MDTLAQDLRYAVRALLNRPWFSALAVLTLAIGIGVNTVAFSAINAVFGKPMRFAGARELGWIQTTGGASPYNHASLPDYVELARDNRTFADIIAEARVPLSMRTGAGHAEQAWGLIVSANYLPTLQARPVLGRLFTADDLAASELPAVVSERFWRERLGGGESIAARSITLNGATFSIVGVLAEGFQGPGGFYEPEVWIPLERVDVLGLSPRLRTRDESWLALVGRLKGDVTPAQAQADLRAIMAQLASTHPATNAGRSITFRPVAEGVPELRLVSRLAWIGLLVVGIVLLIACFNVAGLLLARASERQREMGIRAALGAGRGRILRQLVTEGLLLAGISGIAAVILATWSADLLSAFSLPSPIPLRVHVGVDRRLMLFTFALVVVAGVLPALLPAVHASRVDLLQVLRRQAVPGDASPRVRSLVVIAQVAGSTLFLAAALLFVRSFWNTAMSAPRFDVERTLTMELNPSSFGYDAVRSKQFFERLLERVAAIPGVEQAALADRVPFSIGFPKRVDVTRDDESCAGTTCRSAIEFGVGAGHFGALGLPITSGRDITDREYRANAAVALISEDLATTLWPGADAAGRWIRAGTNGTLVQVVGVVADVRYPPSSSSPRWYVYRPLRAEEFGGRVTIVMRTAGDPEDVVAAVQAQVRALDPSLPAGGIATTRERLELSQWPARTAAGFLVTCGTLALVLATVGLFGVTYYTVSRRTREFGVRVALGASHRQVMSLVLREGLALTLPGVALGILGALIAMHLASRALFGVGPADPVTYVVTAILQTVIALAACVVPAYRAAQSDPMIALRAE